MAVQWQEPIPDEEPMTQEPGPTPAFIAHLSHLGRGALDLWMFLHFSGERFVGTESDIAKDMGRSTRWVTYASRILREHGLLQREASSWRVSTNVPSQHERSVSTNVPSQNNRADFDGTNVRSIQHKRAESAAPPPSHSPHPYAREKNNAPLNPPTPGLTTDAFAHFRGRYPGGHGKWRAAAAVWAQQGCEAIADEVMAGLERWLTSKKWTDGYIHNAENWLADRLWEDAPEQAPPQSRWVQDAKGIWRDRVTGHVRPVM